MITIEDIQKYMNIQNEIDKLCYLYFENNSLDFENYCGWNINKETNNIEINYSYLDYPPYSHGYGVLIVSIEKIIEFANNNI